MWGRGHIYNAVITPWYKEDNTSIWLSAPKKNQASRPMAWALPYDQMGSGVEMLHTTACIRISCGSRELRSVPDNSDAAGQQNTVIRYSIKLRKALESAQFLSNQKMNENGHGRRHWKRRATLGRPRNTVDYFLHGSYDLMLWKKHQVLL